MSQRVRSSRFTIYVPKPEVKFNLGHPIHKPEDVGSSFGYTGASLYSDDNLFVEISSESVYQADGNAMWQSGSKWLQYSDESMVMASDESSVLAASDTVVIVAGAGQGSQSVRDHARPDKSPQVVSYNNLDLHYRVDGVHTSLRQLFYGDDWKTVDKELQAAQITKYDGAAAYPAGGMLEGLRARLAEAGHGKEAIRQVLQPLEWDGNYMETRGKMLPLPTKTSVYKDIAAFDPYGPSSYSSAGAWSMVASVTQAIRYLKRVVDVLNRIAPTLTDFVLLKKIQNVLDVWSNFHQFIGRFSPMSGDMWSDMYAGWQADTHDIKTLHKDADKEEDTAAELPSLSEFFDLSGLPGNTATIEVLNSKGGTPTLIELSLAHSVAKPLELEFTTGAKSAGSLALAVDGTELTLDLNELLRSTDRLQVLYEQLRAKLPEGGVTLSGDKITIKSSARGSKSSISFPADDAEKSVALAGEWFKGLSSRHLEVGVDAGSAAWLSGALSGKLQEISVEVKEPELGGEKQCVLEHEKKGEDSYIKISGGITKRLFGEDPAIAEGEAAENDWNDEGSSWQEVVSSYPEAVTAYIQPLVEAIQEVLSAGDDLGNMINSALETVGIESDSPSAIGLFSEHGITLGTGGGITAAGDYITLISAPGGDSEEEKFVFPIENALKAIGDWDPFSDFWSNRPTGHPLQSPPKPVKKSGGIRVLSSANLLLASQQESRLVGETLLFDAERLAISSAQDVDIASRKGALHLSGSTVVVGRATPHAKVSPATGGVGAPGAAPTGETEWLRLMSSDKLDLNTGAPGVHPGGIRFLMDKESLQLGSRDKEVFQIQTDKPGIYLGAKAGAEFVAVGLEFDGSKVAQGLNFDKQGDIQVSAKAKFELEAAGTKLEVTSASVKVHGKHEVTGDLYVGGALHVKGSSALAPAPGGPPRAVPVSPMTSKIAQLTTDYGQLKTDAGTKLADISRIKAILEAGVASPPPPNPPPTGNTPPAAPTKLTKLQRQTHETELETARAALAELKQQRLDLVRQALLYDVPDTDLGRAEPADTSAFEEP